VRALHHRGFLKELFSVIRRVVSQINFDNRCQKLSNRHTCSVEHNKFSFASRRNWSAIAPELPNLNQYSIAILTSFS
jgi:hypothetical protein